MREIKFRAWDGHTMHKPNDCDEFDFYISCEGEIKFIEETSLGGYEPFRHFRHRQGWQVMQYTGLKDKNGVEIYEGDVLGKCVMNTSVVNVEVIFANGAFLASPLQGEECAEDLWLYIRNEVIGNIHENPELLQS